jgi:hypothetical protein
MLKLRSIFLLSESYDYYFNACKVGISSIPMLLSRSDPSNVLFWYLDNDISDFNNNLFLWAIALRGIYESSLFFFSPEHQTRKENGILYIFFFVAARREPIYITAKKNR